MNWETPDPYQPRCRLWFAWYPVICEDGRTRWLEKVWRVTWWLGGDFCAERLRLDNYYPLADRLKAAAWCVAMKEWPRR